MKRIRLALTSVMAAALLAACGGGGDGNQAPAVQYTQLVSFGDSLSDVGTYATDGLKTLAGTQYVGKYTVNGPNAKNWTELLAAQMKVAAPCAAETGLAPAGGSPIASVAATPTMHAGCYNYAQGGSRVTSLYGPYNAALGASGGGYLGQLTVPVVTQIANHLTAVGGQFSGTELVTVMAGGNDMFMQLATVQAVVTATPSDTAAITAAGTAAVTAMGVAATELANAVKNSIVANGAKRVMVVGMADATLSPGGRSAVASSASTGLLMTSMVRAFNQTLSAALQGTSGVLYVDAYAPSQDQSAHADQYGLTNVTSAACSATNAISAVVGSGLSIACNDATLAAGVTDYSTYLFADNNHLTPYGYRLMAQLFTQKLVARGWL